MSHRIKERLKTVLIYILAITGLTQVGILWSYQNQGTPTSFLSELFDRSPKIDNKIASEKLFVPDRFILTDGSNSHWVVDSTNSHYKSLWKETSDDLKLLFGGKIKLSKTNEKWSDIIEKKSFMIDFGYVVKPELLSWFLAANDSPKQFPDIKKVLIKSDIVDENSITLYIYDDNENVYVSDPVNWSKAAEFGSLMSEVTGSEGKFREYWTFGGARMGVDIDEPDVLYVTGAPKYWPYYKLNMFTYAGFKSEDELARVILGNEKDRYSKSIDDSNTVQFGYGNNIYRYYTDGYLTYRYLGSTEYSGKDGVGKALLNAYTFIARINSSINMSSDIRLTYIYENADGSYKFGFDYRVDGLPVKVGIGSKDVNEDKLEHAISIQADSKRVLKCDWLLKEFTKGSKSNYNDRLMDLLDQNEINFKDLSIQDIATGYFIGSADSKTLDPMLIIKQKNKDDLRLNSAPETGD